MKSKNDKEELADLVSKDSDEIRKKSDDLDKLADVVDDIEDTMNSIKESAPEVAHIMGTLISEYKSQLPLNEHIDYALVKLMERVKTILLIENSEFKSFKQEVVDPLIVRVEQLINRPFSEVSENYRLALESDKNGDEVNALVYLQNAFLDARNIQDRMKKNHLKETINPKMTKKNLVNFINEIKK